MDLKTAIKTYRAASGADFKRPDKGKSYQRGNWCLLTKSGELVAVVFPDGTVMHGAALLAWSRQLSMGLPTPSAW